MPRFFVGDGQICGDRVTIVGEDAVHISRALRMAAGERITVCDRASNEYECVLTDFSDTVTAEIISMRRTAAEPPFFACIWQALPKGEKLDSVIQKSVECGASEIRLFTSERCIVRTDAATERKKLPRRERIALEAAKQSGRGIVPTVAPSVGFDGMLAVASGADIPLFCYEGKGTVPLGRALRDTLERIGKCKDITVSVVVGPEGGFSDTEAERAAASGMIAVGLGPRILRTETVAPFVLGALTYEFELGGNSSNA